MGLFASRKRNARGSVIIDTYDLAILNAIKDLDLIVKEIARQTRLANKNLIIHLRKLVQRGLIEIYRNRAPLQRSKSVHITQEGKELLILLSRKQHQAQP